MSNRVHAQLKPMLRPDSGTTLKRQLYCSIRDAVLDGSVEPGMRLPSTRMLARKLHISRTTVVEVFEQLLADGVTFGRPGAGTFICDDFRPEPLPECSGRRPIAGISNRGLHALRAAANAAPRRAALTGAFTLECGAAHVFPIQKWTRLSARSARAVSFFTKDVEDAGYAPLRRSVMQRLYATGGIRCNAEQIFVFQGVRQALDVTAQLLVQEDDVVCIGEPESPRIRAAFAATGARIVPVPSDGEGMDPSFLTKREGRISVVCAAPSHHFPSGRTLSLARRRALLEIAQRSGAWIVEDDVDGELQYTDDAPEPLQRSDRDGRVVYIGSFSHALFPVTDLAFVVVPSGLVDAFAAARRIGAPSVATLEQTTLTAFLDGGEFARHFENLREEYLSRRDALVSAATRQLGTALMVQPAKSGTYLFGHLHEAFSDVAVSRDAAAFGIDARPASPLIREPGAWNGLLLGFAAATSSQINEGISVLETCIGDATRRSGLI